MTATPSSIPADFPRQKPPSSLAGVQLKLTARLIDGKYVTDYTEEELAARYATCLDLVAQLHAYSVKRWAKVPHLSLDQFLDVLAKSVQEKGWGLTTDEVQWIVTQLRPLLQAEKPT